MRAGDVLRDAGRPVAYHADLARALGSIPAALMLTQLLYWTDKTTDGWVWKLEQDWDDELALSPAVVKGARNVLVGLGIIEHKRDGLPAKPFYRVDLDALDRWWEEAFGHRTSPAKIAHQDGGKSPDIPYTPETTAETTNTPVDVAFDAFWAAYPRKTDKGGARKAWAKAVKKIDAEEIIVDARNYARDPNLPEPQFIPHASTWLNNERWNDGPLPARARGKSHLVPSDAVLANDPNYWEES